MKKLSRLEVWVVIGVVSMLFSTTPQTLASPRMTDVQAIQAASTFCQLIGNPVTATGRAQFPAPNRFPQEAEHHWQKRWLITFGKQATVEVVDATGTIADYSNHTFFQRAALEKGKPLQPFITEAEALQKAQDVQQALGQKDELAFDKISLKQQWRSEQQPWQPVPHGTSAWYIHWTRQFHNIPYRDQGLLVQIDAETGIVIGLGLSFMSRPPSQTSMPMSQDRVVSLIRNYLESRGSDPGLLKNMQLEIVPSEAVNARGEQVSRPDSTARIVWSCHFSSGHELDVDNDTGEILNERDIRILSVSPASSLLQLYADKMKRNPSAPPATPRK